MAEVTALPVKPICAAFLYVFALESLTEKTWAFERPPRIATEMKFPAVLGLANASVEVVVVPASLPICCTRTMLAATEAVFVSEKLAGFATPETEPVTK